MEEQKNKCWSCLKYKAFYIRSYRLFSKKDMGYCQNYKKIVGENETCENWLHGFASSPFRQFAIKEQLAEIANRLAIIEKALEEDVNVNEIK